MSSESGANIDSGTRVYTLDINTSSIFLRDRKKTNKIDFLIESFFFSEQISCWDIF